ncbi:glycosyltransferase family 39 protein [Leptolyngbya sp. KIOST-1]|uniref:glycosyltransferase family 39 protein n=1 Tax=Leptolyngbya sp. KIOST-1 TaxID=1229172 RepID=UPI0012E0245F|nr:glycosyltransferase family 39 protein [Leptolyngbya sp. KIOST-1]
MAQGWIWVWVRRVAIAAIALGLVLRFAHLDRKVYWHDEAYTSLRVAGYQGTEVLEAVLDRPSLTAADLQRYLQMPPEPSLGRTWMALAHNPEHPPLYYLLAHGWGRLWGASVWGYRAIAAIFGAIALPLVFWLTRQLFPAQPGTAWVAAALAALAPVQIIYSQEAREYGLWMVGLLLAHGTLVRALRSGTWSAWGLYGLAVGLAWHGSLLTGLLCLSHGAVLLGQRQRQAWIGFGLAQGLGLALFTPWMWTIVHFWHRLRAVTAWTNEPKPLEVLAQLWGLHYSATVVDFNPPLYRWYTGLGPLLVLALLAVALGYLWRRQPRAVALFLTCGLLVPPLVLIGSDLLRNGQISTNSRYFLPSLLLVPVAIAPLITAGLSAPGRRRPALAGALLALLLTLGLASAAVNTRAVTWWNKSLSYPNIYLATYLNQLPDPVLIFNRNGIALGEALSLSHYLRPDTRMWLLPAETLPADDLKTLGETHPGATLILFEPSPVLLETVPPGWQTALATDTDRFAPTDLVRLLPPP